MTSHLLVMRIFTSPFWHFLLVFAYWTVSDAANQCPFKDPKDRTALSFCTKASSSTKNSSETVLIGTWNAPTESTWTCSCYVSTFNKNSYWTASLTYGGQEHFPCPVRLQVGGYDWSSCENIAQTPVEYNSYTKITLTKTVLEHQPLCVTLSAPDGLAVMCLKNIISTIVSTIQTSGTAGTAGTSTTNTPETTTKSQESDTETIVVIVVVCFVVVVIVTIASVCIIKLKKKRKPKKEVKDDKGQKDPDYDVTTITENWLYHVDMNDVTSTTPTPIYHDIDEPLNKNGVVSELRAVSECSSHKYDYITIEAISK